ncbi:hypothetical protein ACFQES_08480 [Nonomuraea salmonea]|uniref:hypothetical protein n=1 Tax=Nonomuraea salmonea TaxID=46181 RepID=UPI00360E0508
MIQWTEAGLRRSAPWRSVLGAPPPARVVVADDRTKADTAYKLACEGTALLWQGDFHNARQLLTAMGRRCRPAAPGSGFHRHRQAQSQRARTLGMLLIPYDADHVVPLRRAPDVREACAAVHGPHAPPAVGPLRELLGLIGAHEWRVKGVHVPALDARIHPPRRLLPDQGRIRGPGGRGAAARRPAGLRRRHRHGRAGGRAGQARGPPGGGHRPRRAGRRLRR